MNVKSDPKLVTTKRKLDADSQLLVSPPWDGLLIDGAPLGFYVCLFHFASMKRLSPHLLAGNGFHHREFKNPCSSNVNWSTIQPWLFSNVLNCPMFTFNIIYSLVTSDITLMDF
jgi:hypothetical protein